MTSLAAPLLLPFSFTWTSHVFILYCPSILRAFYIHAVIVTVPQLHKNQRTEPHQPRHTSWMSATLDILRTAFYAKPLNPSTSNWDKQGPDDASIFQDFSRGLEEICALLGLENMPKHHILDHEVQMSFMHLVNPSFSQRPISLFHPIPTIPDL